MKILKLTAVLTILILANAIGQQGWFYQSPDPTFENLNSIYFANNSTGWAVGYKNTIIKTTDAGETWTNKSYWGKNILSSVHFINQNKGCIVGYDSDYPPLNGKILFTSDGGETWDSANVNITLKLNSVFFASEQVVYTVGEEATILKSTDGGVNWNDIGLDSSYALNSLFFINENTGWVVGNSRRILKTTDGGTNWEPQYISTLYENLYSIFFINSNKGRVSGENIVAITNDGGETWTEIPTGYYGQKSIVFENENNGYLAGNDWTNGFILKSTDGGITWSESFISETYLLNSIAVTTSNNIFAVSEKGGIIATTDGGSQWDVKTKYIDARFLAVCFANENVGVAAGIRRVDGDYYGSIYRSSDGGNTWVLKDSVYKVIFLKLCFVNESLGWAIGENWDIGAGTLMHTTDGGDNWYLQHSFSGMFGESVCFINEMSGWVVGTNVHIYHTSDGGINWDLQNSGASNQLFDVFFIDELNGWSVGYEIILKTTDGGINWIDVTPSGYIFNYLNNVQFVNNSTGWTVGDNGTILKSTDAGNTWFSQGGPAYPHFRTMYFTDEMHGWIAGNSGPVYNTSDGGENWQLQSYMNYETRSIFMLNNTTGWIAGGYASSGYPYRGIILKTTSSVTTTFPLSINVTHGWNMVSVPGTNPAGMGVDTWWSGKDPGAGVFKYAGGYVAVTTTTPTEGYWMKNSGAQVYNYPAIEIVPHNDVPLVLGWNLIGLYETTVPTASVTTNPPGIITTPIFEYSGGYQVATDIVPGYGYWAKADAVGSIVNLSAPPLSKKGGEAVEFFPDEWGKIILTDASGINYTLYAVTGQVDLDKYELPPMPPAGMFDIRYGSGRMAEDISSEKIIHLNSINYPITIRSEGLDIILKDKINGKLLNEKIFSGEDTRLANDKITSIEVIGKIAAGLPISYKLYQNHPNPFNPTTTIQFAIPKESDVSLSIYNVLGELVTTLVNEQMKTGYHQIEFDASQFASGVYLYRIQAGDFVQAKKMVLLK